MYAVNLSLAALFAACLMLLAPSFVLAQSEPVVEVPDEVVEQVTVEVPAVVDESAPTWQPIWATTESLGNGVHLVSGAAGPIGVPIFEGGTHSLRGMSQGELRLARDVRMATFSWPCDTGTCVGTALDFWNAMPVEQRQDYLRAQIEADRINLPRVTRWDVQVRQGTSGEPVECATYSVGDPDVTFMLGACPPSPVVTPRR